MCKTYVVVMGRNYTSLLGMIRSVGQAGYLIGVIRTIRDPRSKTKTIDAYSKYVDKYTYAIEPNRQGLIEIIKSEFIHKASNVVLIPTDDFTASVIDELSEQLREDFLFPYVKGKAGSLTDLMDKNKQKILAGKVGLNTAESWTVQVSPNGYKLPSGIIYPCFTKPQISLAGNKTYMRKCENESQLRDMLDLIKKNTKDQCPILIERYLSIDREYAIQGCSIDDEVFIPGIIKKIRTASGTHKGVTAIGEVINSQDLKECVSKIQEFVKQMHFVGIFDIEVIESDGIIFFNELNLRSGAYGFAVTCAGCNLSRILITYLVDGSAIGKCHVFPNKVFVSEKVDIEDYEEGYISFKTYKEDIRNADFALIKDDLDKGPYREFKKTVLKKRIKKFTKSFMRG